MAQDNQPTRTLLLTGASRGIGHATVKRFGAAGWRVLTVSRHAFSEHCPWDGGKDNHIQLDLSDLKGLPAAIEAIREKLPEGRLDAMVNNAAISPKLSDGGRMGVLDTDMDAWQRVFAVNFFSVAMLGRSLIDELTAAKGAILNLSLIHI